VVTIHELTVMPKLLQLTGSSGVSRIADGREPISHFARTAPQIFNPPHDRLQPEDHRRRTSISYVIRLRAWSEGDGVVGIAIILEIE
jgi:hypothetical protein